MRFLKVIIRVIVTNKKKQKLSYDLEHYAEMSSIGRPKVTGEATLSFFAGKRRQNKGIAGNPHIKCVNWR